MSDLLEISRERAAQGARPAGQVWERRRPARLLALAAVGGRPSGGPRKKNDRGDKQSWIEIKASHCLRAIEGASRKQVLRELTKYFSEAELLEIEAKLAAAAKLKDETMGRYCRN
jgi:hypothetical protein